ncbi:MAG: hypothetical protein KF823_10975 [Xanthomonadales bacterium]|nr:hypothetical protein [Xanthomonadales bacterium]
MARTRAGLFATPQVSVTLHAGTFRVTDREPDPAGFPGVAESSQSNPHRAAGPHSSGPSRRRQALCALERQPQRPGAARRPQAAAAIRPVADGRTEGAGPSVACSVSVNLAAGGMYARPDRSGRPSRLPM